MQHLTDPEHRFVLADCRPPWFTLEESTLSGPQHKDVSLLEVAVEGNSLTSNDLSI